MSELGDTYKAWNEIKKSKRHGNVQSSLRYLDHKKIPFLVLNESNWHTLVNSNIDFWPSTGKWHVRLKKHTGRGVRTLLEYIKRHEAKTVNDD